MDLWQSEYEVFDERCKTAEKRLKLFEEEKTETIAMRRRKELSLEDYKEEMKRIEADIVGAHNEVTYNLVDRNQLKVLLDQSELFLNNVEPLFIGFSTANKQRLAHFIFPQGVLYADGKLRTPKKALMLEFIEAIESKNLDEFEKVSAQGIEP